MKTVFIQANEEKTACMLENIDTLEVINAITNLATTPTAKIKLITNFINNWLTVGQIYGFTSNLG